MLRFALVFAVLAPLLASPARAQHDLVPGAPDGLSSAAPAPADDVKVDPKKVHYGKIQDFDPARGDRVGTVEPKTVYEEIPAYQTIVREDVQRGTARYQKLMAEATRVYRKAITTVGEEGWVLIVEKGGITGYPTTDLTPSIIAAL